MLTIEEYWPIAREAALRGAKFLDEHKPGWDRSVDTDTLELNDCRKCVLGQLFHGYEDGLKEYFPGLATDYGYSDEEQQAQIDAEVAADQWAIDHGFKISEADIPMGGYYLHTVLDRYEALTEVWVEIIEERRK